MKYIYNPALYVSQHATQKIIFEFFAARAPAHTMLVDVGAFGRFMSNTYALLLLGWQGLLIEPNPRRRDIILEEFSNTNIELLTMGAGDVRDELPFYLHKTVGYDTLSPTWRPEDKSGEVISIPVAPLADILDEKKFPKDFDFLSVDTEGYDNKIMKKFFEDSDFKPTLIITEAASYPLGNDLFRRHGYNLHAVAGGPISGNLIYSKRV